MLGEILTSPSEISTSSKRQHAPHKSPARHRCSRGATPALQTVPPPRLAACRRSQPALRAGNACCGRIERIGSHWRLEGYDMQTSGGSSHPRRIISQTPIPIIPPRGAGFERFPTRIWKARCACLMSHSKWHGRCTLSTSLEKMRERSSSWSSQICSNSFFRRSRSCKSSCCALHVSCTGGCKLSVDLGLS